MTTLGELVHSGQFPYVCHGHTHKVRDERIGEVHVINPGALRRARRHTVAILDTDGDTLEHVVV
jgi:predicted phosphodiesterase